MMYTDENRGVIQFRDRAKQLVSFEGLRYGKVTPTNLDGFIEKDDKLYIFYEFKHGDAEMPYGQYLALVRLVDALAETERIAILLVCKHNTDNSDEDVDAANSIVEKYYYNKKWHYANNNFYTAREITDYFYNKTIN